MRPTPDALREQAFAILGPRLGGATLLDLFAGTGIVSLEALSRGVGETIAVERSRESADLVRRNLAQFRGAADRCRLMVQQALKAVEILGAAGARCDIAWCDPPFAMWGEGVEAVVLAGNLGVLVRDALVIIETPSPRSPVPQGFVLERSLRGAMLVRSVV